LRSKEKLAINLAAVVMELLSVSKQIALQDQRVFVTFCGQKVKESLKRAFIFFYK
jgi:hypothetical protein